MWEGNKQAHFWSWIENKIERILKNQILTITIYDAKYKVIWIKIKLIPSWQYS